MHAELQTAVTLVVYGLGPLLIFTGAYLGWRRIRHHSRRYGAHNYDEARASERKKFWGYE